MKLRIETEFTDKYNGKKYEVGSEVEFEDERAKELLNDNRSLVTKIKEAPKAQEAPKAAPKKTTKKTTKK